MVEEQTVCVEWLEKAHPELQEKHAKSCDDIFQMMEMLKILTRGNKMVKLLICNQKPHD